MELNRILQLSPEFRDYVWGGRRLRPNGELTAEAWVIYEKDLVTDGPFRGRSLAALSQEFGAALLGTYPTNKTGNRFPLLIKLLDCATWLSLQVHPNDEQAQRLEGPDQFGKTEAWHIIEAAENAQLIAGVLPGISNDQLSTAIRSGTIIDWAQYHSVHAGDSLLMPPGTIHALGPGLLLYEVQQTSDLTYRVYDWGRPETPARRLHIEKSLEVVNPDSAVDIIPLTESFSTKKKRLITCPYFTLEHIHGSDQSIRMDTLGVSFHALTVISGKAKIIAGDESVELDLFSSVLVPAFCGEYSIIPQKNCTLLKSSVEPFVP